MRERGFSNIKLSGLGTKSLCHLFIMASIWRNTCKGGVKDDARPEHRGESADLKSSLLQF